MAELPDIDPQKPIDDTENTQPPVVEDPEDAANELEQRFPTEIVTLDIDELSFADYNPRSISQLELQKLANSITKFGFADPVIVNSTELEGKKNRIIGGHQRVRAAIMLGWPTVPVVYVDAPTIGQEKALNVALNKISGDWDGGLLAELLSELADDPTIDELDTGFDRGEIDKLIQAADVAPPDDFESVTGGGADGGIETEYRCPSCNYSWSGNPKPEGVVRTEEEDDGELPEDGDPDPDVFDPDEVSQ